MVKSTEDRIPLTQSPSITQETKARFNELLNAALLRESVAEPKVFKRSNVATPNRQSEGVPKIVPRQKRTVKSPEVDQYNEKYGNISSVYSSEESSDNRKVKRQVIAEVHSSQTQLLQSSSEDDILSERKERRKRKKSRWKQVTESAQLITDGQDNSSFRIDEETVERSSSRISSRSYVLETPTVLTETMTVQTTKLQSEESSSVIKYENKDNSPSRLSNRSYTIDNSPSRLSNRSYTIEIPTFPIDNLKSLSSKSNTTESPKLDADGVKDESPCLSNRSYTIEVPMSPVEDEPALPKIKTPIPLPRRKSLKSPGSDSDRHEMKRGEMYNNAQSENEPNHTIITINDPQGTYDEQEILRGSAVVKLQDSASVCTEEDGDMPLSVRKQKRKKKRHKRPKSREQVEMQEFSFQSNIVIDSNLEVKQTTLSFKSDVKTRTIPKEESTLSTGGQILSATIHGVDCTLVHPLVHHPVVRLYIVNTSTGEYYSKSDPGRNVCYYSENTSYIQPIMTHPFDFKQHRTVIPLWEECLLLNESFHHLLTASTLMLFEVCDYLNASVASARYRSLGSAAGWYVVSWAFLRPVAPDGSLNVGSRLRLQMYRPGKQPKAHRHLTPAIYEWWGTAARHKYPGCLYVTLAGVDPPATPILPSLRSRVALQAEQGSEASVRSASTPGSAHNSDDGGNQEHQKAKVAETVVWSRLAAQSCKLPNTRLHSLPVDGSMCVQFSGDGLWLACAKQEIQLYSVPQFQHTITLIGHQGLVYSLRWSADNKILLSASADCTVCVWRPNHRKAPLLQMLAHPTFVYCAAFVPIPDHCSIVTGCRDGTIRLWRGKTHSSYQLTQDLVAHAGFVTSVCVTVDGSWVVSADSEGSLRVYDVEAGSLSGGRELRVREARGTIINNVVAHPGGHRLLVHTRNSTVLSVDLATGAVIQIFKGCSNDHVQTGVCVSACGSLVFACGEDGSLTAWDGQTGALRAVYCGLLPSGSAAVHYHPHEHMLAIGALSQPPVYILTFDRNATGEDVGLNIVKNEINARDVIDQIKSIQSSNKWQKMASKIITNSPLNSNAAQEKDGTREKKKKKKRGEKTDETNKKHATSTNWPSLPQLEYYVDKSSGDKDLRLLEIIRRMDSIILAAKQSSQTS